MNKEIQKSLDFYKHGWKTVTKDDENGNVEMYVEKDRMDEFLEYALNKAYNEGIKDGKTWGIKFLEFLDKLLAK